MMDILQCVDFLKRLHIFRNLDDSQLTEVAEALVEVSYEPGQQIVRQGEKGDKFFIITAGSVDVLRGAREKQRRLAALVRGDYFGEEALLAHGARNATVQALEATRLMELTHNDFHALLKKIPKLRTNIEVAVASHRLARTRRFDWIQDGEVIYFIARKHPIVLWRSLLGPFFTLVLPSGLLAAFIASANPLLLYASGVALLGVGLWTLYNVIDWTNDYYIVTNRRAIWLEKVIGLYDSRQEAPLSTVLSVGVETDQVGRILDYGTVNIRTFVGRIIFNHVHRPYQAASLVEEHWTRTREGARQADSEAMKQAIRERLGLAPPEMTRKASPPPAIISPYKPNLFGVLFRNIFKVRFEYGTTITYRKHWFVLLRQTWQPGLLFLVMTAVLAIRLASLPQVEAAAAGPDFLVTLCLIGMGVGSLWWLYQYIDWSNDIFQVTDEQILDIDRTPFGAEEKRAAPLDNILSTEYKRIGFLQVILNYGNVYITVGGTQLIFEDVLNPPGVQQDIDQRRIARVERKRQADARFERERVADWFASYHKSSQDFESNIKDDTGGVG